MNNNQATKDTDEIWTGYVDWIYQKGQVVCTLLMYIISVETTASEECANRPPKNKI
jgi:hypothetical protein